MSDEFERRFAGILEQISLLGVDPTIEAGRNISAHDLDRLLRFVEEEALAIWEPQFLCALARAIYALNVYWHPSADDGL